MDCPRVYYERAWPRHIIERYLSTRVCEVIVRTHVDSEPIRHLGVPDMARLVGERCPRDGVHIVFDDHAESPLVFDVDHTPTTPPAPWCMCTDGGRRICEQCWIRLCGAMRSYEFVLRRHFGSADVLACFSGGRGWHMFVLDAPPQPRAVVYRWMQRTVPHALRTAAKAVQRLCASDPNKLYTLDAVAVAGCSMNMLRDTLADRVDTIAVLLYRQVMVPFFRDIWMPHVARTSSVRAALAHASAVLSDDIRSSYAVALSLIEAGERAALQIPPLENRLDAFFVIASLLWEAPDESVGSASHPIRMWWSPHQRSGNFSLPVPIHRAHELVPETLRAADAATPGTTAHTWMQISLREVTDLLQRDERRPRAAVWPA